MISCDCLSTSHNMGYCRKEDFEFGQSLMTLDSIEPCVRLAPNTGGDQGEITGGNSM